MARDNVLSTRKNFEKFHFLDLHWEDIIVSKILPYLNIEECFSFRSTSKACLTIADSHISKMKSLKLLNKRPSTTTLNVFERHCKHLKVINMNKTINVTDGMLLPILKKNPRLSNLNLSNCSNLTAKCLQPVIIAKPANLTTLKLAKCHWLTTGAIEALTLHQSELEDVDLSFCYGLTEASIEIFVKKFCKIKVLNLEGNTQLTDKTLMLLATYCKNIRLLNVGKCYEMTDYGINALAFNCRNLQGIMTKGCPRITIQNDRIRKLHELRELGKV